MKNTSVTALTKRSTNILTSSSLLSKLSMGLNESIMSFYITQELIIANLLATYWVNEEVRKDPEVNTEVEQSQPHNQSQKDKAHLYKHKIVNKGRKSYQDNESVEGEIPDANFQPQGPNWETHKCECNKDTND